MKLILQNLDHNICKLVIFCHLMGDAFSVSAGEGGLFTGFNRPKVSENFNGFLMSKRSLVSNLKSQGTKYLDKEKIRLLL